MEAGEPLAMLTRNLNYAFDKTFSWGETYIDTNNAPWAASFLESSGLAKPTGETSASGYCEYPPYRFDMNMLEDMDPEDVASYAAGWDATAGRSGKSRLATKAERAKEAAAFPS